MKTRSSSKEVAAVFFLLPSGVGLLLFNIIPILSSLVLSLTRWDGLKKLGWNLLEEDFAAISNYMEILKSEEFWRVLRNTTYFIILYLPMIIAASVMVAVLLNQKIRFVGAYRVAYYIPVLTSWVAGALVWKWILSPEYGMLNGILSLAGIEGPGWLQDEHWAMPGIVLASIWKDMGYFGLIFLGGLQGINPSYYEAADMDGAKSWQKFLYITIPMLSPVTFFVVITCIINSFQLFPQVMVMTSAGGTDPGGPQGATQVMVERIYRYAFKYYKMGFASAFSWLLFVVIFMLTTIQLKLQKKWVNYDA